MSGEEKSEMKSLLILGSTLTTLHVEPGLLVHGVLLLKCVMTLEFLRKKDLSTLLDPIKTDTFTVSW